MITGIFCIYYAEWKYFVVCISTVVVSVENFSFFIWNAILFKNAYKPKTTKCPVDGLYALQMLL